MDGEASHFLARARLEFSGVARHRFIAVKSTGLAASIHHRPGGWIVEDGMVAIDAADAYEVANESVVDAVGDVANVCGTGCAGRDEAQAGVWSPTSPIRMSELGRKSNAPSCASRALGGFGRQVGVVVRAVRVARRRHPRWRLTSAGDVTAVTATTVVVGTSGLSEANATEAGAITIQSCENLLIDTRPVFAAMQVSPTVRVVPLADSTSSALQVRRPLGPRGCGRCLPGHPQPGVRSLMISVRWRLSQARAGLHGRVRRTQRLSGRPKHPRPAGHR